MATEPQSHDYKKLRDSFPLFNLSCGLWEYVGSSLVFSPCYSDLRAGKVVIGTKQILIKLNAKTDDQDDARVIINYMSIESIVSDTSPVPTLTFTMKEAPMMYLQLPMTPELLAERFACLANGDVNGMDRKMGVERVCHLSERHKIISGVAFVYRVTLDSFSDLVDAEAKLRATHSAPNSIRCEARSTGRVRNLKSELNILYNELSQGKSMRGTPYCIKFQCQRLAYNGILSPGIVLRLLPHIQELVQTIDVIAVAEAMRALSHVLPFPGPDTDSSVYKVDKLVQLIRFRAEKFSQRGSIYETARKHEHLGLVHKICVTPACIYLEGPDLENMNRVLRKYPEHTDHFIRVSFSDEDGEQLKYEPSVSRNLVFQKFKNVLVGKKVDDILRVCGRLLSYIGYSNSSLRTSQCWTMATFFEDRMVYPSDVIKSLGNFTDIQVPARCAARIGQCFSDTTDTVPLEKDVVDVMLDIERNGRCFTDGVGVISWEQLREVWKKFSLAGRKHATCIQIRFQGVKGMLALDHSLQGKVVKFRESMQKFRESPSKDLEVVGAGYKPLPMYLNRQLICILEGLGTHSAALLGLQQRALEGLEDMVKLPINAARYLEINRYGTACKLPSLIRWLYYIGMDYHEDDFLHHAVEVATRVQLRELKHRARIPVDNAHTLIGVVDETGELPEGHIHVIIMKDDGLPVQRTGRALITRAPALHPGDVQFVEVDPVPEGSNNIHLHNCIIFSQQGERDLPSMLSGGDLDGDLFSVIFDESLFPSRIVDPADYPRVTAKGLGRTVTSEDMADFFIQFMEQDKLGYICNTHMIIADQKEEGVFSRQCLTLAEMASTAVDFSKTGIPVDLTMFPARDTWQTTKRPDFMAPVPRLVLKDDMQITTIDEMDEDPAPDAIARELNSKPNRYGYYESKKVLGQLYRAIDETKFLSTIESRAAPEFKGRHKQLPLLRRLWKYIQRQTQLHSNWQEHREFARRVREQYNDDLHIFMYQYSPHPQDPLSELEIFMGTILGKEGGLPSRRVRDTNSNMKETYERYVSSTIDWILRGDEPEQDEPDQESIFAEATPHGQRDGRHEEATPHPSNSGTTAPEPRPVQPAWANFKAAIDARDAASAAATAQAQAQATPRKVQYKETFVKTESSGLGKDAKVISKTVTTTGATEGGKPTKRVDKNDDTAKPSSASAPSRKEIASKGGEDASLDVKPANEDSKSTLAALTNGPAQALGIGDWSKKSSTSQSATDTNAKGGALERVGAANGSQEPTTVKTIPGKENTPTAPKPTTSTPISTPGSTFNPSAYGAKYAFRSADAPPIPTARKAIPSPTKPATPPPPPQPVPRNLALERCIACFAIAIEEPGPHYPRGVGELRSFTYVAAAVCLGQIRRMQGGNLQTTLPSERMRLWEDRW